MKKIPIKLNKKTGKYEKRCTYCKKMIEASNEFFSYTNIKEFKLKAICKKCISLKGQKNYKERSGVKKKKCIKCKNKYKKTKEFFRIGESGKLGNICKKCTAEYQKTSEYFGSGSLYNNNSVKLCLSNWKRSNNKKRLDHENNETYLIRIFSKNVGRSSKL